MTIRMRSNRVLRHSLWTVVLQDNLLYFFGYVFTFGSMRIHSVTLFLRVSILLVLNNLMVVVSCYIDIILILDLIPLSLFFPYLVDCLAHTMV